MVAAPVAAGFIFIAGVPGCAEKTVGADRPEPPPLIDPRRSAGTGPSGERPRWTPDAALQRHEETIPTLGATSTVEEVRAAEPNRRPTSGWSIAVATFSGPEHRAAAQRAIAEFAQVSGLSGTWVESGPSGSMIRYGHYSAPSDSSAQRDLRRIKEITVEGGQPWRSAMLSPISPPAADRGRAPQFNLLTVRDQFPGVDPIYTLQIGVYEEADGFSTREARAMAEEGAIRLRREGELAFYYHGPNRSHVTVGVVFADAIDARSGLFSPEVQAIQRRFPHNAYNGFTLRESQRAGAERVIVTEQPSFLVAVPRE